MLIARRFRKFIHKNTVNYVKYSKFLNFNRSIFLQIQSDSESSSPIVELNSATEISTDSEFEQDPVKFPPPNIVIDDTHLRKPTKVQVNTIKQLKKIS